MHASGSSASALDTLLAGKREEIDGWRRLGIKSTRQSRLARTRDSKRGGEVGQGQKRETLKDGSTVYRARGVSCGRWPNGKRRLRTITGRTKKEVEAEVARITGARANGTYVHAWNGDVNELIDAYLKTSAFGRAANTALNYSKALLPARERLGIDARPGPSPGGTSRTCATGCSRRAASAAGRPAPGSARGRYG